ncbi:MAG: helix-hairpin-helix domain-containing protein [Armatimonadota bacterium]|jgi:competence protein ComEA|nr:hypothetical protein [Armatimonadota bacterium]
MAFNFNRPQLLAAFVIVLMALAGTAAVVLKSGVFGQPEPEYLSASSEKPGLGDVTITPLPPQKLWVHVTGCVQKPGVYQFAPGARVQDAIRAAGGASKTADLESINLAEKLADGEQVFIARKGSEPLPSKSCVRGGNKPVSFQSVKNTAGNATDSRPQKLTVPGKGVININTAGLEDLQRLPGIGPSTAEKILEYRKANGAFTSIDELDEVKGIGPAKIATLKPFVSL